MSKIKTIEPGSISQPALHHYLLSAVAPRPICFASTIDKEGNVNLSPFSFFNVFSSNPPIMVFSPARSGRDMSTKNTHDNVMEVKEVVINIVNHPMVEQMSLSSTAYAKGVNEFVKAGFTQVPSEKVKPPRVGEAPVAFECVVDDIIELGQGPGAGNLVIARVVLLHVQEEYLDEEGKLDTKKLDLVARMGGSWYCHAREEVLFEIPKPLRTHGIGVDQLPRSIRESNILSANNLGRLGNIQQLPEQAKILKIKQQSEVSDLISQHEGTVLKDKFHSLAKGWLEGGKTEEAMELLLLCDLLD